MRLLIVEDEKELAQTIKDELDKDFVVEIAGTGEEGEYLAMVNEYDLIILDLVLPGISGLEVCQRIRDSQIKCPILILTGQGEVQNKVTVLDQGADDYLVKPFNIDELKARIRALLRRPVQMTGPTILSVGDLTLNLTKGLVKREDKIIHLRRKELHILEYLMRNVGIIITREMILDHAWESGKETWTNTVDVHIKYLRNKIDKPFNRKLIKTVYGLGYKIEPS